MTHHLPEVEHVDTDLDPVLARRAGAEVVRRFGTGEEARELIAMLGLDGARMRTSPREAHRMGADPKLPTAADEEPDVPDQDWRARAACQHSDTDLWFPLSKGVIPAYVASTCGACKVRPDCARWALDTGQTYGVWAGRDLEMPAERMALERDLSGPDGALICSCGTPYATEGYAPCSRGQVPAARSGQVIAELRALGWNITRIVTTAKLARETIAAIESGARGHVQPRVEAALTEALATATAPAVVYAPLPADVRARVIELREVGLTNSEIGELLGCSKDVASAIIGGRVKNVVAELIGVVRALPMDEAVAS